MFLKKVPYRDCNEMGAISKYVSNRAFLYEIYRKNDTFSNKFGLRKTKSSNFEIKINNLCKVNVF